MEFFPESFGALPYFLLATSFIKLLVALSVLRFGIGLDGLGFGIAILLFAVTLTLFQVENLVSDRPSTGSEVQVNWEERTLPFLKSHADPKITVLFEELAKRTDSQDEQAEQQQSSYSVYLASFVVSELHEALFLGVIFLIPFLLIDLCVANGLTLLGIHGIKTIVVSLPAKLIFFLLIDGWALVSQRLLVSYAGG